MENYLIITKSQADAIRGNYGSYSAIEPIGLPDGTYFIPERCMSDPDLQSALSTLETMDDVKKPIEYLPEIGQLCVSGQTYYYSNGLELGYSEFVICRQEHNRTIYEPWETPALFTFTRPSVSGSTLDWIQNEYVYSGWTRVYSGTTYEVIQEHLTQISWVPPLTLNVLWKVYVDPSVIPDWVQPTGASDDYNIGDLVKFEGAVWKSVINGNVWSPTVYPAGWQWLYDL